MKLDIARAWKDETYRQSLSSDELAMLPENPVGEIELTDTDLASVQGAAGGQFAIFTANAQFCINNPHNSANGGFCNSFGGSCFSLGGDCHSNRGDCSSASGNGTCVSNNGGGCQSVGGGCLSFNSGGGSCLG